jgi:hypothetical protein
VVIHWWSEVAVWPHAWRYCALIGGAILLVLLVADTNDCWLWWPRSDLHSWPRREEDRGATGGEDRCASGRGLVPVNDFYVVGPSIFLFGKLK